MSVLVKYTETPWNSYDYLVEVGYWGGIVNLRTYSPIPKPLCINKRVVGFDEAEAILGVIPGQFSKEEHTYEIVQENIDLLAE